MKQGILEIHCGAVDCTLRGIYPHEALDRTTSYSSPGAYFTDAFQSRKWDGRVRLLRRRKFPAGLLNRVCTVLDQERVAYRIMRPDFPPASKSFLLPDVRLRPYQLPAVVAAIKKHRGRIIIPTGGGKTLIAAAIMRACPPAAFVVHTTALMDQSAAEFQPFGEVSRYGAGSKDLDAPVAVCMAQSLRTLIGRRRRVPELDRFRTLVIDEAHHVAATGAKTVWYSAARKFEQADRRIGLTATPPKKRYRMLLEATTGPLLHEIALKDLQDQGWLARSEIRFKCIDQPSGIFTAPYASAYRKGIEDNPARNRYAVGCCRNLLTKISALILVQVETIRHGCEVHRMLADEYGEHWRVCWINGRCPRKTIQAALESARAGQVDILIATRKLFGEGVDIPPITAIINLAAGKKGRLLTQTLGRGLRQTEDRKPLIYIDFKDQFNSTLLDHSAARIGQCRKLKQEVEIVP